MKQTAFSGTLCFNGDHWKIEKRSGDGRNAVDRRQRQKYRCFMLI